VWCGAPRCLAGEPVVFLHLRLQYACEVCIECECNRRLRAITVRRLETILDVIQELKCEGTTEILITHAEVRETIGDHVVKNIPGISDTTEAKGGRSAGRPNSARESKHRIIPSTAVDTDLS
jgi:hypothetical protein